MTAPNRYRQPETPDEHLAAVRAQRRGEPRLRFETDTYRKALIDALRSAGLDAEADEVDAGGKSNAARLTRLGVERA